MPPIPEPGERQGSPYRWVILALVTLSGFLVMGFPTTGLSALFSEIADSLGLDLIQIGVIWGVGSVMGIFTSLLGGTFIDQFGTRRTLVALCLATGITGALRGFAFDFWSLFFSSFFFGMVQPILPMNFVKLNREWFASGQLGFASGVMSAGFATGLMLGSRLVRYRSIASIGRMARRSGLPRRLCHHHGHCLGNLASADRARQRQAPRSQRDHRQFAPRRGLSRTLGHRAGCIWRAGADARPGWLRANLLARNRLGSG